MSQPGEQYLFDTNIIIAFLNGEKSVIEKIYQLEVLNVSVITIGEMLYGANKSSNLKSNIEVYNDFFNNCNIYIVDKKVSECYGKIRSELSQNGTPIPENDIWIAAIAKSNNKIIVSRDKHLNQIKFIKTEKW